MSENNIPEWQKQREDIKSNKSGYSIRPKNGFFYNLNEDLSNTAVFNFLYIILNIYLYSAYADPSGITFNSVNTLNDFIVTSLQVLSTLTLYYICYIRSVKLKRKSIFIIVLISDIITFSCSFNIFIVLIELILDISAFILANINYEDDMERFS